MKLLLVLAIFIILLLLTFVLKLFVKNRQLAKKLKGIDRAEKWHELAYTDTLTGLYNRNAYNKHIASIEYKNSEDISIITLFDIDDFKKINDEKGHLEGDSVLKYVARTLLSLFRPPQYKVYRLGGDEFALISKNVSEEELIEDLVKLNDILAKDGNIRLSKGYCVINKNVKSAFKEADEMLYADKLAKNRR